MKSVATTRRSLIAMLILGVAASASRSATCIWDGGGGDILASTKANWTGDIAPTQATDHVVLNGTTNKNMTWDLTNAVVSWTQTNYTGGVRFNTGFSGTFTNVVITGDCIVSNGTWWHPRSGASPTYRIHVKVGGNFTLGSNATINVNSNGYDRGCGPGAGSAACANGQPAASYGGLGGDAINPTYGLYTMPTNLGSAAWAYGGGAVWLRVGGVATINGTITARPSADLAQASGGSIFIEAGSLAGSGVLDVSCPWNSWIQRGGGGGRIAIILGSGTTFGSVKMYAYGGQSQDAVSGSAGTIYLQKAGQPAGRGRLIINQNGISTLTRTMMPVTATGLDLLTALVITNKAVLGLRPQTPLNLGTGTNIFTYGPAQSTIAVSCTTNLGLSGSCSFRSYTLNVYTNLSVLGNLTISNAVVTMFCGMPSNVYVAGHVTIKTNGVLSHGPNEGTEAYKLRMHVVSNLTIDVGGSINVDAKGYGRGLGLGAGSGANANAQPAASYGGLGADAYNLPYGSYSAPTNLGSSAYTIGGGAVIATVNGTTTVNGSISARTTAPGLAQGTGGSIYLTTGNLQGSGTLDASCPYNASSSNQRGGGGGRIAVILSSGTTFGSVKMYAYGGRTLDGLWGAAGTIYRLKAGQPAGRGTLAIDNNGNDTSTRTLLTTADTQLNLLTALVITNKGVLGLIPQTPLNLGTGTNIFTYGPAQSTIATSCATNLGLSGSCKFSRYTLNIYTNLDVAGDLTVTGAVVNAFCTHPVLVKVTGNLYVRTNGVISHAPNGATEAYKLTLQVGGNMVIDKGGSLNADGKGYGRGLGPGRGSGANANGQPAASYGGLGGDYIKQTYGSLLAPTNLGSSAYALAGGAVIATVAGTSTVNGTISARPLTDLAQGSGGSIYLRTGYLGGNGSIDVSCPWNSWIQRGGGGGRIAVILTNGTSFGSVNMYAYGGESQNSISGAAGTVYRQTALQGGGCGALTVDNVAIPAPTNITTQLPPMSNAVPSELFKLTLVVTNSTYVQITANSKLGDMFLTENTVKLYLKGFILRMGVPEHPDWGGPSRVVYDGGAIIWKKWGAVFTLL